MFYKKIKNHSLSNCLKDSIRDIWTHSSTAIEGNTLSLGETAFVLNEGLTISGKKISEHNEIIGHSKAITILYDLISEKQPLTENVLFDLHKAIMLNPVIDVQAPVGKWKIESNFTQLINDDNKIEYKEYPKPNEIPCLMNSWFNLFNAISNEEPLIQYAKLHISFGSIHPFADGNGRIARLIANIPVLQNGLVPITISNNNRKEYIHLLQYSKVDKDLNIVKGLDEFIKFVKKEWLLSQELFTQAIEKSESN